MAIVSNKCALVYDTMIRAFPAIFIKVDASASPEIFSREAPEY